MIDNYPVCDVCDAFMDSSSSSLTCHRCMAENCDTCGGTGACFRCRGTGKMPPLTPIALSGRARAEIRRFESGETEFILFDRHGGWLRTILESETAASLAQALEADPIHEWQTDTERYNNLQCITLWPDGNLGMRRYNQQWIVDGNQWTAVNGTPIVTTDADARHQLARALAVCVVSPDPDAVEQKNRTDDNLRSVFG